MTKVGKGIRVAVRAGGAWRLTVQVVLIVARAVDSNGEAEGIGGGCGMCQRQGWILKIS